MNEYKIDAKLVGEKLVSLREQQNKTRREVAKDTGITVSALSNYENGLRVARDEVKRRLAYYYGVSIESIYYA